MPVLVDASPDGVVQSDDIRALGVRMDGVTACEIVYGVGRTTAYELHECPTADHGGRALVRGMLLRVAATLQNVQIRWQLRQNHAMSTHL